jgi:hypothetical protein
VHAADGPPDAPAVLRIELVERAAANLREHGVEDAFDLAQGRARADVDRGHGRDLGSGEVAEERVLVQDGLPGPAAGPIELHDQPALVLELHLVDAILERSKRADTGRCSEDRRPRPRRARDPASARKTSPRAVRPR